MNCPLDTRFLIMYKQFFVLLSSFYVIPVCAMEEKKPLVSDMLILSRDIARNSIQPLLSLQEIAYIKQASKACNLLYDPYPICSLVGSCSSHSCITFAKNYYLCTKALVHFAKKDDSELFKHVWTHHAQLRDNNVAELIKTKSAITVSDALAVYSNHYGEPKKIRRHIFDYVCRAVHCDNISLANILLSGSTLSIFDLWVDVTVMEKMSSFCLDLNCIFKKVCALGDTELIRNICGGPVAICSFPYIMEYANSGVMLDLIVKGVLPVDSANKLGKSVLHYAAEKGFKHVVEIALKKGAYVNCADLKGMTPLHYAVKGAHLDAVLVLLASADVDVRFANKKGKKPIDYNVTVKNAWLEKPVILDCRKTIRRILKSCLEQHRICPYSGSKLYDDGYQKV